MAQIISTVIEKTAWVSLGTQISQIPQMIDDATDTISA